MSVSEVFSCSVLFYSNKDVCLAGNNEDNFLPYTQMQFFPAEKGKFGCVYWGYYPIYCPEEATKQGGMNEKGLFYDGLSLPPVPIHISSDKPVYTGNLMEKILEECATVDEAINILSKYNLINLTTGQTFIADKSGNAAIIERDTIIMIKDNWLAATNFRLSEVRSGQYPCDRYNTMQTMLDTMHSETVKEISNILNRVSVKGRGPTIYSNVCDLKTKEIYLYHFHNFDKLVKLNLDEELRKGKHTLRIEELFPKNPEFIAFEQQTKKDFDELSNSRNRLLEKFENELHETSENIDTATTGMDILNYSIKCTGGKKGKEYIKTLTIDGEINSQIVLGTNVGEFKGKFKAYKKKTGEYYEQLRLDGLITIEKTTNGEISWKRDTYSPSSLMDKAENERFKLSAAIEQNDIDLFEEIKYLGEFTINGHECFKILCTTVSGYSIAKYIGKNSGLIWAELTVANNTENGPVKTWTTFDNYHNKLMLPNRTITEITEQTPYAIGTSIYIVDCIYIENALVDENLFRKPNELLGENQSD